MKAQRQSLTLPTEADVSAVFGALTTDPQTIEAISERVSRLPASQVTAALTLLEIQGWAKQTGVNHYVGA